MKDSLKKISFALVVFVLPIFTLLPYSPWVMKGVYRDSGVFLYVGQQIFNGVLLSYPIKPFQQWAVYQYFP